MRIQQNIYFSHLKHATFKGNEKRSFSIHSNIGYLNHRTYMFREPAIDEFIQNQIKEKLSHQNKVSIVFGACSSGEEAMSYVVMLDDFLDKLDISAFDIDEKSIERAKQGKISIFNNPHENFLLENTASTPFEEACSSKFHKYFKWTGVERRPNIFFYFNGDNSSKYYEYQLQEDMLKKINFFKGDIRALDKLCKKDSIDVLFFRNSLYHILCENTETSRRAEVYNSRMIADSIAQKMAYTVNSGGLVVFGLKEYEQGVKGATISSAMEKSGFEPINIKPEDRDKSLSKYCSIYEFDKSYHPVWKKV